MNTIGVAEEAHKPAMDSDSDEPQVSMEPKVRLL